MSSDQGANENQVETSDMSTESDSLRAALERLSTTETGLGFIYSALALLVERFNLVDAVIVLEDENVGTQIFRFEGKAVSKNFAAQLGVVPGVYCDPRVVVADDLELVRFACQRELSRHRTRLATAHEPRAHFEDLRTEVTFAHAVRKRIDAIAERLNVTTREVTRAVVTRSNQSRKLERVSVFVARARERSARELLSAVLAVVDVLTLSLTVANVHGPVRYFLGLILGIVIPGWSVVGLIKLKNPALETGLTLATSLAFVLLAAQLLITAGFWHPIVFEEFTCVVFFPSLLWQSGWRLRRIGHVK
jgi:hypothetical protein